MRLAWIKGSVCAAVAVTALAACGSSGSSTKSDAAAAPSSAPATLTGAPIRIGIIAPTNSPVTSYPEAHEDAEIAVAAVNAAGGVKGRPLQLYYCDDETNAQQESQCAQQVIVGDKVVALVGSSPGLGGASLYPVLQAAGTINFGDFPNNAADLSNPLSYPFAQSTGALSLEAGALKQGSGNIDYVTYADYAAYVKGLITPGFEAKGYTANVVPFDQNSSDYSIAAAQAARNNPKYVMVGTSQDVTSAVFEALVEAGVTHSTYLLLRSQVDPKVIQSIGQTGVKPEVLISDFDADPSNPTLQQYNADVAKYGAQYGMTDPTVVEGINAWLAVILFAKVAADLPQITGPALKAYLNKQSDFVTGLTHPLNFTKPGPVPGNPRLFNVWIHKGELDFSNDTIVQTPGPWINGLG